MKINNRIDQISEYHFKDINKIKEDLMTKGKKLIDLGIGDPDLPIDKEITNALINSCSNSGFNNYPPYDGLDELKKEIIKYYDSVYNVQLHMDEVIILIGSKEGISNIIPAACDISDVAIVPSPGYPVYENCCKLWGVETYSIPLLEKNNYLPDVNNIPDHIIKKSKLFFINYPNNPTGAVANEDFYKHIIKFAEDNNILLCNDAAYAEIVEECSNAESLLKYDSNKSCIEFGTFSKTFNMTGFRIGYAVGNKEAIKKLGKVKSNLDSGQFIPIQKAAIAALNLKRIKIISQRKIYDDRRKTAMKYLDACKIDYYKGKGTFYIWCKVPFKYTVDEFCKKVLTEYGIVVTPGYAFGNTGYGFFRISLTKPKAVIESALELMKNHE